MSRFVYYGLNIVFFGLVSVGFLLQASDRGLEAERIKLEKIAEGDDVNAAAEASLTLWGHFKAESQEEQASLWQRKYIDLQQKKAEGGDESAMIYLGSLYAKGNEMFPQDMGKSLEWFEKAAEAGNLNAQYQTAVYYQVGVAGIRDEEKAKKWFEKARGLLEQTADEDKGSSFWLGQMYFQGLGVEKDDAKALEYYKKSGEQGHLRAQVMAALMYREGKGVEVNEPEAFQWFVRAAQQDDMGAIMEVAMAFLEGKGTEANVGEAMKWLHKGVSLGDVYASRELGRIYAEGRGGIPRDEEKAMVYFKKAADLGDVYSALEASKLLKNDDVEAAYEILQKAAYDSKQPQALYELALLQKERGDSDLYVKQMHEAAENGYTPAMVEMGRLHITPFSGVSWNPRISYYWWSAAESRGDEFAAKSKTWLVWGGGSLLLLMVVALIFFLNRLVKRRAQNQEISK